ncbi:N-acetylglucosamine kinase [Microbacterium rhizomatis]|uniref:ATPase BadF/BadG/BcrA/BcrD type domain-containing protein n=1 Tax=Microbacterium rhizomatis TaxID=1631477 RepID=A0A5J5IZS6_9MICO|nr:BadF/BadG/BcrA/BcrD ATPase family protein [Microbacterium rhizomatis]KAA9105554.1 hypothetical protein F6B43_17415 [Microbacterium rhizomatis]
MSHVIGIDIGGTKTHVALASADDATAVVREFAVPSSSWRGPLGDFAGDAAGLAGLLAEHFSPDLLRSAIVVGTHGCENTAQCHELERALAQHVPGPVMVVNDSELIAPAMREIGAIGLVVGTGSIATARDGAGELVTAGGWGWLLGDEGSASGLVREATRAVLAQIDDGEPLDALGHRLFAAFSARDGAELALAVSQAASAEEWGTYAPEVFAAADEGSALAARVIADGAEHLGLLVDRLLRRGVSGEVVVAGGSVIERQPRLQDALRAALEHVRPGLDLKILDRPPVEGAIALARRMLRLDPSTMHHQIGESPS